jgi:serine/threonine-protein kinase
MNDVARELVGNTLAGRFRITGYLGEGSMASVYRAEQDADPKDVAVKVMHPELLRDETFAKRFAREAKAAARIVHPNTVRILESGADGDYLYLAMELLVGLDLFDTLAKSGRLPEARAVKIAIQVCSALEAAHAQRIVHRDLKPENVFVERDPQDPEADIVKVLDFGIAKTMERDVSDAPPPSSDAPPSSALTRVGSIVGTPEYMAPEQAMGLPVDARTDVYACGVLLFHMVTGRAPFVGKSPIEVILQVNSDAPPAPSALAPGIHASLERLILQALAKTPDSRPQSARALREALEALLPELGESRRAPVPSSAKKVAGLPGVPGEVAISREREGRSDGDEPPATLRSLPEAAGGASAGAEAPAIEEAKPATATPPRTSTTPSAKEEALTTDAVRASAKVDDAEPESSSDEPFQIRPIDAPPATQKRLKREPQAEAPLFAAGAKGGWVLPPWALLAIMVAVAAIVWLMNKR